MRLFTAASLASVSLLRPGIIGIRGGSTVAAAISVGERRDSLIRPPLDERRYRFVELSNGLRTVLVHDETAEKAAAAIEIRAGHFSDPEDMPGLAHFCEHMCFLGTELEPEEGAFKAFLQRHGGSSNAFTGMEATGFHFSVGSSALPGALERFAAFFTCSLMRESSCSREMQAIDSEFRRNLQSDLRRVFQLVKSTSSPTHPFHKFSTGNLQTLSAAERPHAAVHSFYLEHYIAPKMQLCVLGRESLDELEEMVVRCFGGLRTAAPEAADALAASPTADAAFAAAAPAAAEGAVDAPAADAGDAADSGPLSAAQRGALLRVTPVRETRLLRLMWQLPPEAHFRETSLLRYLSSVSSTEREGSLNWLLVHHLDPPLATSVGASSLYSLSDATMWGVSVTLTPEGLAR